MREYQRIYLDAHGEFPHSCAHCSGEILAFGRAADGGCVHHIDQDKSNNELSNLEMLHTRCHTTHHLRTDPARQASAAHKRWAKPEWAEAVARAQARRDRVASETKEEMIARRNDSIRAAWASDELRQKLSAATKGKPKPEGFGRRVSAATKGVPKSPEHVAAVRRAAQVRAVCSECGFESNRSGVARHRKRHG